MTTPRPPAPARHLRRALALTPAAVLPLAGPASAAPAPDQWPAVEPVAPLDFLLVLVIIPGALFVVIYLLSSIGSMVRAQSGYQPGLAWRHEPEWFGGPRDGLDKLDTQQRVPAGDAPERGGASGRW